ncbi:MAG: hypothetical protein PT934_00445 [Peptoniphilaceae bacterium]|uniref:hypothetical protein n=1 Tax=Parvimonas sp. TaxID=1944660 RepID=UPI002A760B25|nr:hypothetical protein [Parvimonas sp.]MDD7764219.1 hypothetical protein [Peptoniphilaceae bacterium]MDY3050425.1 hypothetical protein [Parvimonas sp.]
MCKKFINKLKNGIYWVKEIKSNQYKLSTKYDIKIFRKYNIIKLLDRKVILNVYVKDKENKKTEQNTLFVIEN